jgi:hypothetical protein
MADVGGQWRAGCTGAANLPYRRLVFTANNARYCLLFYEIGGIAEYYKVALFSLDNNAAKVVWSGNIDGPYGSKINTLEQLREALKLRRIRTASSI